MIVLIASWRPGAQLLYDAKYHDRRRASSDYRLRWYLLPQSRILQRGPEGSLPVEGIGFIEAHGLALILGITLWRASATRSWHLTAAATHLLLGAANLAFWNIFVEADMLALGYLSTVLHGVFVALQLTAAVAARAASPDE